MLHTMNKALSDLSLQEILELIIEHGSVSQAARVTGFSRHAIQDKVDEIREQFPGVLPVGGARSGWASAEKINLKEEPKPLDHVELRRAKDNSAALAARVKDLEKRLIETEDAYAALYRLEKAKIEPVSWKPRASVHTGSELLPILFTSDFQCGEVIDAAELDGMNAYNKEIFAERYQLLIDKTISLAKHNTGAASFPGIIYCRGGDAISGGIHEELSENDDLSSVPAVRWLMKHEREGIRRLKDAFGRVKVISIPGNHGRNTHKKRSKGYVEHSYETLLAWWLKTTFEDDCFVSFDTPASGDAYFDAMGWKFLMSHGDRMGSRGGGGFIGPAATIARGHKKLYDTWTQSGLRVDKILTGHLHSSMALELGYANGALAGYSEYARDLRCYPDAAKQWLLFSSQKMCVTHAFEVQVSDPPKRIVSDSWAA